ncbi:MAG: malonate decarboxylase subunit alpha [Alphaproteobacteria bacterium]|nr:malonate decarboxylase subunit alpha [Alphaproteobacteria bacterium]
MADPTQKPLGHGCPVGTDHDREVPEIDLLSPLTIRGVTDVTHVVTEEGVAYLYKTESLEERKAAIVAIAGATDIGRRADPKRTAELRTRGIVATPEDLGVRRAEARRTLLAARSIDDLVAWSDGLYEPPAKFRSW